MDKEDIEATVWQLQCFINDGVGYDVPGDIRTLIAHIADLEEERKEMQARIEELEVYEEREMIGDPAGLGGPSISDSLRERDSAQADAENSRYQLDWANERIRDLENDIRSHKRTCPMFQ
jgi:hypothetical protein